MAQLKSISTPERPSGTQSIQRVVMLLRELAAHNRSGSRLVDLVNNLGLEQPTVHRMLKSLIAEGMVMQSSTDRRYFLGQSMFEFGLAAAHRFGLRAMCEPSLDALARDTGDTIFLTLRSGSEAVCIDRREGASPIKIFTLTVGDRRPLGIGAGGLAMLGALPLEAAREAVVASAARLPAYGLDVETVLRQVARTRKLGYALHDVNNFDGVKALGLPITDSSGLPVAAISLSTLSSRLTGERLNNVLALVRTRILSIEAILTE